MITPQSPSRARVRQFAGFTLLELLIVVSIILILAGLTIGAFRFANVKAARDKTRAQLKAIELVLERYSLDYGSYPIPNDSGEFTLGVTTIDETHGPAGLSSSGAQMLYILMSGDSNGDGVVDGNETPILSGTTGAIEAGLSDKFGFVEVTGGNKYVVVDGFGNPIMYSVNISVDDDSDPATPEVTQPSVSGHTQRNGTYDLWSVADDEDSLNTNSVPEKWITNW